MLVLQGALFQVRPQQGEVQTQRMEAAPLAGTETEDFFAVENGQRIKFVRQCRFAPALSGEEQKTRYRHRLVSLGREMDLQFLPSFVIRLSWPQWQCCFSRLHGEWDSGNGGEN